MEKCYGSTYFSINRDEKEDGDLKMSACPECAGKMKYDSNARRYVCHRCGLALTRHELDKMREAHRDRVREEKRKPEYIHRYVRTDEWHEVVSEVPAPSGNNKFNYSRFIRTPHCKDGYKAIHAQFRKRGWKVAEIGGLLIRDGLDFQALADALLYTASYKEVYDKYVDAHLKKHGQLIEIIGPDVGTTAYFFMRKADLLFQKKRRKKNRIIYNTAHELLLGTGFTLKI